MIRVLCLCVETLQFGRGIPSIWCVKNLTCILEHVVYGLCGLACLMHHRLISKMLYTFQTLLGRVKWWSELNLDRGPWIWHVWCGGLVFSDRHLPRLITFYSTWQTDVPQMLCLIYTFFFFFFTSFSLQFTVLATSGFPFPVVCTIPPWLLSPSSHATCCAGRPKFSFCVFFLMPSVKVAVLNLAFPTPGQTPSAIIISLCRYNTLSEDLQPRRPSLRSLITNLFGVIERTPFVYTTFQSPLSVEIRELFN